MFKKLFPKKPEAANIIENFDGYIPAGQMRLGKDTWLFGAADNEPGEVDDKPVPLPMAQRGMQAFKLEPLLLTQDGEIESYKIQMISKYGHHRGWLPSGSLPAPVEEKMLDIAREHHLQGYAGYHSIKQSNQSSSPEVLDSHRITLNGKDWHFSESQTKDGESKIAMALLQPTNPLLNVTPWGIALLPDEIGDDGKITRYQTMQYFPDRGWATGIPEEKIPPRLLQELVDYANHFQHFATLGAEHKQKLEAQADAVLQNSHLDLEMAQTMLAHHQGEMDEFLRYFSLARQENPSLTVKDLLDEEQQASLKATSTAIADCRRAVEALKKPKNHADRIRFEREAGKTFERGAA